MGRIHTLAFFLKPEYERSILKGHKRWEGRAVATGNRASKVQAGDTVGFRITKAQRRGFVRRLQLRVAEVRKFPSCKAMLKGIGIKKLLPDCDGDLERACAIYEGLVGGGKYAAWRIDPKSCRAWETKTPAKHWTRTMGMVQAGKVQPKLLPAQELVLTKFGQAMRRAGHSLDAVQAHKDRLRFCGRVASRSISARGLWPLHAAYRGDDEGRRAKIRNINFSKFGVPTGGASILSLKRRYLVISFNWLLKYADKVSLKPKCGLAAMKASSAKRQRR